jgi:hypothetical protein
MSDTPLVGIITGSKSGLACQILGVDMDEYRARIPGLTKKMAGS